MATLPILRGSMQRQNQTVSLGSLKVSPVVKVTQAQVQALNTTEVQIVPGLTNSVLIPYFMVTKKLAGAYTVAGVTMCLLGYGTVSDNLPCFPFLNSPAFSPLVTAGVDYMYAQGMQHNGTAAGLPFALNFPALAVSKKLAIRTTGASPAGAGGELRCRVWYYQVPFSLFDLPA